MPSAPPPKTPPAKSQPVRTPPGKAPPGKVAKPEPEPTAQEKLQKLAQSGYVDVNDVGVFIADLKPKKPDRALLKELRDIAIKRQGVFDKGAFHKLKTFCDTYRAENDVD